MHGLLGNFTALHRALRAGDAALGLPGTDGRSRDHDALYYGPGAAACDGPGGEVCGALAGGLDFAAHLFASAARAVLNDHAAFAPDGRRDPAAAARADPPAPFYDGDFIAQRSGAGEGLRRLEGYRPALDAGFGRAGALFLAEADRVAALVAAVQAAFFVVGTLFLFFLYVGMFRGMIARLGDESSRASQFLETIPGTCRAQLPQFFGADDPAAAP
eukprot:tig00021434_g21299.t1